MAARKFLSGIDLASQKAIHAADGSAADDLATYGQVLNLVNGLDFHPSVRAASTANITVSAPGATVDGVTMAATNRLLLKNQTTASENGLWVWNGAAVPLTRAADGVTGELSAGATVVVTEGTVGAPSGIPTQWTLATPDPITVGTTALSFNQSGSATPDTAGNGLQKIGTAFSVKLPASSGLVADGTGTYIDTTIVVRKFAVTIGDGSSTAIAVTHNLGTRDVVVTVYDAATFVEVETDVVHTSTTVATLNFAVAPASNAYRVVVLA